MDTERQVASLMSVARRSKDAESLYEIANRLQQLGAWDSANEVRGWAKDVERKEAEKVTQK